MTDVLNHPMVYVPGSLEIVRGEPEHAGRFTLRGNYQAVGTHTANHFQLIYEALEIAAHSNDKFAPAFRAMCDELMALSEDWAD